MANPGNGSNGAQGAAVEQIATITATLGSEDLGDFPIYRNIGVEMPHDDPQPGQCIGGIKTYRPSEMTIGRRLTTNATMEGLVKNRAEMATPRHFTFRLLKGNDRSVSRSVSVTNVHVLKFWFETLPDARGGYQPYEFMTFQPEGVTFG